ncbi:unnamed protein product [Kluyveromyces dobzhanskii CBS 2104]|uniref:WGS project CCBQ000000000 data, contig 00012 n=1 Tax=Kluyveromyces dobzhanskii CBS 2104 TaxID=1427455 RepID=A0A0A8L0E6_9SACH|nr:unnamed protein product [Kluyveromyces dobzhanskii CBS 2104]
MFGAVNSGSGTMNGGGLFGNKPATGNTGFKFGGQQQQQQQQQPGGNNGLFGQNNNTMGNTGNSGGGFFGNTQQQAKAATGGMFGSTNTSAGGTGGMFGQSSQQSGTNTSTGLFGNSNSVAPQQNNSASTGGGLFGSKPSGGLFGSTQQPNTGGGLFGNNNSNAGNSGGLFGNSGNTAASSNSGGLFGGNAQAGQTTGGLFGNNTSNTGSTGGLFGAKPQAPGSSSLFGQPQAQQGQQVQQGQQQGGSPLFGAAPSNSMQPSFAWSNTQQQQQPQQQLPSVQQPQQQLQIQQQQQQQQISNYPQQIQEQILKCKESWVPSEQRSKLKTFVYNKCTETEAMLYNKPLSISQEDWDQALMSKPTNNTIPIRLLGFQDLNDRNQLQKQHVAQARVLLGQILEKLNQVNTKHDLDTQSRIAKAVSRSTVIENRILKLASQLAVLKSKNLPLSIHEEETMNKFDKLLQESNDPAGLGKNNELWARLSVLKERAKNISDQLDSTLVVISENGGNSNTKKNTQDEELEDRVNKIAEILSNQQRGLCFLNDVMEKDQKLVDETRSKINR